MFVAILGCLSCWILAPEFFRPASHAFPQTTRGAELIAADRNAAATTASLGIVRGDLWADYALTYLDLVENDKSDRRGVRGAKMAEQARRVAERALALAPHDAQVWLILAALETKYHLSGDAPAVALRMSYYTGANETDLVRLRLRLALNSKALSDKDFQELVRHDIRLIVQRKPEMKPAILAVYQHAVPLGQKFLRESLKDIDPTLAGELH